MAGDSGAGYFRVPLVTAAAIAKEAGDPDALAAWMILRRFAYGLRRELTATGAKKIAGALGIDRRRATRILSALLAIRFGERGECAAMMTAADWNAAHGHNVRAMKGNAPVYVLPDMDGGNAYLPDLLIPPGDGVRCYLAQLADLEAEQGLDALLTLLWAHECIACGDYIGADPERFASYPWALQGSSDGGHELGHIGTAGGRHYWLAREDGGAYGSWDAIEFVTGHRDDTGAKRFWQARDALRRLGMLCKVAIVSDARGRMSYPLWVYGESHRQRLAALGIFGLASRFHRQATGAGMEAAEMLAADAATDETGAFICATDSRAEPVIRSVYVPTLLAPTPDNMAGLEAVRAKIARWG